MDGGPTQKGLLRLALSAAGTTTHAGHEERCPDINGPSCDLNPVPAQWHDVRLIFTDVRLAVDLGVTDWLALEILWSLRIVDIKFELQDLERRKPILAPYGEEIHHRTETLVGLTDPWLSGRAQKRLGPWSFSLRAGLTIPIGSTVENPFRLGRAGRSHQHIQFGSGTVDPFVEVQLARSVRNFRITAWLMAKASLYENSFGYRAGNLLLGGARATSDLWTRRLDFMLGALAYHEQAERWSGVVESEGNLGRTDVMIESSVGWRFVKDWSVFVLARVPVWSHTVGAQLSTPAILEVGLAKPFRL